MSDVYRVSGWVGDMKGGIYEESGPPAERPLLSAPAMAVAGMAEESTAKGTGDVDEDRVRPLPSLPEREGWRVGGLEREWVETVS